MRDASSTPMPESLEPRCFAEKSKSSRLGSRTQNGCLKRYAKDQRTQKRGFARLYPQERVRTRYFNSYEMLHNSTQMEKPRVVNEMAMRPREFPAGQSQRIPPIFPVDLWAPTQTSTHRRMASPFRLWGAAFLCHTLARFSWVPNKASLSLP